MNFKIEKLSKENLEDAIKLIEQIFTLYPQDKDHPRLWLPASLSPKTKKNKELYATTGCTELKHFVATKNNKVIGITGFFTFKKDEEEADWLAWYAVDKKYRRQGIGTNLLEFVINNARKRKKKYLRLYTSMAEEEKEAQLLYEKFGLKIIKKEKSPYQEGSIVIYRELKLI